MDKKLRKSSEHRCEFCRRMFTATRSDAHYCSYTCRQKSYYKRSDEKYVRMLIDNIVQDVRRQQRAGAQIHWMIVLNLPHELGILKNEKLYRQLPTDHELKKYVEGDLTKAVYDLYYTHYSNRKSG